MVFLSVSTGEECGHPLPETLLCPDGHASRQPYSLPAPQFCCVHFSTFSLMRIDLNVAVAAEKQFKTAWGRLMGWRVIAGRATGSLALTQCSTVEPCSSTLTGCFAHGRAGDRENCDGEGLPEEIRPRSTALQEPEFFLCHRADDVSGRSRR